MRGGYETDADRESALGRIPVWLPLEDVQRLAKHCFCEAPRQGKFPRHSMTCKYLRKRVEAALDKAGAKDAP